MKPELCILKMYAEVNSLSPFLIHRQLSTFPDMESQWCFFYHWNCDGEKSVYVVGYSPLLIYWREKKFWEKCELNKVVREEFTALPSLKNQAQLFLYLQWHELSNIYNRRYKIVIKSSNCFGDAMISRSLIGCLNLWC